MLDCLSLKFKPLGQIHYSAVLTQPLTVHSVNPIPHRPASHQYPTGRPSKIKEK